MRRPRIIVLARLLPAAVLAATVVLPGTALAGGYCRGVQASVGRGNTVQMKDFCYSPTVLHASPDQPITFVNLDAEAHTVTGAGDWGTGHKELAKGQAVSIRLTEPGLYLYACLVHPGMQGAVYVGEGQAPLVARAGHTEVVSLDLLAEELAGEAQGRAASQDIGAVPASNSGTAVPAAAAALFAGVGLAGGLLAGRVRRKPKDPGSPS